METLSAEEAAEMTKLSPDDDPPSSIVAKDDLLLQPDPLSPPSPSQSLLRHGRQKHQGHHLRLRLIFLISVAFLALTAMAAISQQLFLRHFADQVHPHRHRLNVTDGGSLLAQNLTRGPLHGTMLRHVNRTQVPATSAEQNIYDYDDVEEVVVEVAESLVEVDGCWSQLVENHLHWNMAGMRDLPPYPGLEDSTVRELRALRNATIVHLEPGSKQHCGSENNAFLLFQDGGPGCALYREPHQQLILGEILSYYLSRLLGMGNVPAAALSQVCPM